MVATQTGIARVSRGIREDNTSAKTALSNSKSPTAANALQIDTLINSGDSVQDLRQPIWLKRFLQKKKMK
jgi:hypothetical protein